jgi:hypothetical protein
MKKRNLLGVLVAALFAPVAFCRQHFVAGLMGAERTVIEGLSGCTVAISATLPATYDAAGYGATSVVYTAIGQVESYGDHGVTAAITEFTPVDTAVVTKVKGSKNYGNMSLTLGCLPSDAGQDIVQTASESNAHYSLKLTYPDTSVHYMDVLVSKFTDLGGDVNDVHKISAEFAICRKPVIVAQA